MIRESCQSFVDRVIERTGSGPEATLPILQELQREYRYLPPDAMQCVAERTGQTLSQLYGVATFYRQFRHKPMGRHSARVCHGTACHVRGAARVTDALRGHLGLADGEDTDADGNFTVENVFCVGCCSLAPVIQVDDVPFGRQDHRSATGVLAEFLHMRRDAARREGVPAVTGRADAARGRVRVCLDSCCVARGTSDVHAAVRAAIAADALPLVVERQSCALMCEQMPMLEIDMPGRPVARYVRVQPDAVADILKLHARPPSVWRRARAAAADLATKFRDGRWWEPGRPRPADSEPAMRAFYGRQVHIATEHYGRFDPLDFDAYAAHDGWSAVRACLQSGRAEAIVEAVRASGLRGRGGGGFPTGDKWQAMRAAADPQRYVICNGDEGDPGAFMDRMLMESFPFRVIEGMILAAYAVGAAQGTIYVRAEYPYAVARLREALARCRAEGLLGDDVLGSGFRFDIGIFEGAGAFVCGEETVLMESMEGRRGIPRDKPPYPVEHGLWGHPTLVNNVETFAVVPWIMRHGAAAFAALGTERSRGTKVFALAGKVVWPGLVEVPMGITLREIVEEIGGGMAGGKRFKAVQVGGPSGGCLPAALAHTPVDYEALRAVGTIMGSGGLIVLDEDDCMVDVARYFMRFLAHESCGKCTFCRVGTQRMLEILDRLCEGRGHAADLRELEHLASLTTQGSLCGLGRTAPHPVLSTLKYFRSEYEAHVAGRCPAGRCVALVCYAVNDACTGCTLCAQNCPTDAIPVAPYRKHRIEESLCTRCDACRVVCPAHAIDILPLRSDG